VTRGLARGGVSTVLLALLVWPTASTRPFAGSPAQAAPNVPRDVASLLTSAGFLDSDLALLRDGNVITRTQSSPENLEASVVTAVRIATPHERTLAYFHQLVSYVDGQVTTGYGTFKRPPADTDLNALTFDSADLADLRACQPALCGVRIGAVAPADIAQAVDWNAPDAPARAQTWGRRALVAYAADYLSRGTAALKMYDEQAMAVDLQAHWRAIFERSTALPSLAPLLHTYLSAFPSAAAPPDAADVLYWDRQRYTGLKPMIGITHQVTWRDKARPDRIIVAQRQVFASHYLYGSLATALIQQDTSGAAPVSYVVYFNRSRGDLLKGAQTTTATGFRARVANLGAALQRRVGEQLIKDSAERLLSSMKEALER
jgi:hypothetical protein